MTASPVDTPAARDGHALPRARRAATLLGLLGAGVHAGVLLDLVPVATIGDRLGAGRGARVGQRADVVVLLGVAQPHRVRRLLHARQQRRQQLLLGEDQVLPVVAGQLVLVAHGQRPGRAGLDAQSAEDAPGVVDLVDRWRTAHPARTARSSVLSPPST